jgi:hypothetical protein
MNTTPTWETLSEKERVRWLLEHVMGYFILPDSACVRGHMAIPKGLEGFRWPLAYYDDAIEIWYTKEIAEHPNIFGPMYDMNDAWALIKRIVELYGDVTEAPFDLDRFWPKFDFMRHMGLHSAYESEQDEMCVSVAQLAAWTPSRICEAVYHAVQKSGPSPT